MLMHFDLILFQIKKVSTIDIFRYFTFYQLEIDSLTLKVDAREAV